MTEKKKPEEQPIAAMSNEEREDAWDDIYVKEEGEIIEFNFDSMTGKIRSLRDGSEYTIDSRERVRTRLELRPGDKVFFAPIESPEGDDYARVIRIIDLKTSGDD